jgi:hypothetical protein
VRTNDPYGKDMLFGHVHWTGVNLVSADGDSYFLDEEIEKWEGLRKTAKGKNTLNAYLYTINGKERLLFDAYHPSSWAAITTSQDLKNIITKNNLQI